MHSDRGSSNLIKSANGIGLAITNHFFTVMCLTLEMKIKIKPVSDLGWHMKVTQIQFSTEKFKFHESYAIQTVMKKT